jgi:hypothetical protein
LKGRRTQIAPSWIVLNVAKARGEFFVPAAPAL